MPEEETVLIPATEQPFADAPEKDTGQVEAAAPETEEPQPVDPGDVDEGEPSGEEPGPDEQPQESVTDDLEDFEWNGETIRGPKGLKEAVMKNADYTQKTQEVADRRRELETFEQSLRQQAEATDEEMDIRARTWAQDAQLKQYENIDWRTWAEQDPIAAQQARYQYDDLVRQVGEGKQQLNEFATKRNQGAQQDFAKRVGETREYAQKNIQGFSPEVEKRVVDFAIEQGVTPTDLQASLNPVVFNILHKAMLGADVLKKNMAANNPKAVPLKTVSSRSNAPVRKSFSDMSMEEYAKARKAQGYVDPSG